MNATITKWFIIAYDIFITVFVIAGSIALGLEILTKPYFLAPIGAALSVNGAYLATIGREKKLKNSKLISAIIMVIGFVFLFLTIVVVLSKTM